MTTYGDGCYDNELHSECRFIVPIKTNVEKKKFPVGFDNIRNLFVKNKTRTGDDGKGDEINEDDVCLLD